MNLSMRYSNRSKTSQMHCHQRKQSVSVVKMVLDLLTMDLLLPAQEDMELTCHLKRKMTEVLEKKYSALLTQKLLKKASFLDPRYKNSTPSEEMRDGNGDGDGNRMMELHSQDPVRQQPEETRHGK